MNKWIIVLSIILAVIVALVLVGNALLAPYDLTVFDLISIFFDSLTSQAGLGSLESVKGSIDEQTYEELSSSKNSTIQKMESWRENVNRINNDTSITQVVRDELGEEFTVYMFSVYDYEGTRFKVIEWTVKQEDGIITVFEQGKPEKFDSTVEFDHELTDDLLSGNFTEEQALKWVKQKKVKVRPLSMVSKIVNLVQRISE